MLEASRPDFRQWIDVNDLRAASFRFLQRGQHARVIRARILADDEDCFCHVEVFERDRALAYAYGFSQGRAARFMAHVGAVRQIIRAKLANEELIEKSRLVARAPGSVEDRFVRRSESV